MAQYNKTGYEAQSDALFPTNTNEEIDAADINLMFEHTADSVAFTADVNNFSEDNVIAEVDHVLVVGATGVPGYTNTNEVKPRLHVFSADQYAIRIENNDNVDTDTKSWVVGQEDDGDFAIARISESGGTDTLNSVVIIDQNDDCTFTGEGNFGSGSNGSINLSIVDATISNGETRKFICTGTTSGASRSCELGVTKLSGNTNPAPFLRLDEEDGASRFMWNDNNGDFRISGNSTFIGTTSGTVVGTQTSDERLKGDIKPLEQGLKEIIELLPIRYNKEGKEEIGFSAQKTKDVIPESVYDTNELIKEGEPTKLAMDYVRIIPVLVNAIKELNEKIDNLQT